MRQAEVLAQAQIVPAAYRRNPANVVVAALTGRAFGWDALTAMRNITVIDGTASIKPEAMLGLIRRAGHSVVIERSETTAKVVGRRCDTGDELATSFSMDDAKRANLAGKGAWRTYPVDMMQWRAVAALARGLFSDVVLGLSYTPEELGAEVNGEGEVVEQFGLPAHMVAVVDAKRRLLEACGGDVDAARSLWGERGRNPLSTDELEALLEKAADECIEDAEVVEDVFTDPEWSSTASEVAA
jgi:hypothetical protein